MKMKGLALFCSLLLLTLVGCAGGGSVQLRGNETAPSGTPPTRAIVKLTTTGALPAGKRIGGVGATLSYPSGKGLRITQENVVVSGAGAGSTMVANASPSGYVMLGLINVGGIEVGEFATLSFEIAKGQSIAAADFSVLAGANAIDTATLPLPGIAVSIASVTFQ